MQRSRSCSRNSQPSSSPTQFNQCSEARSSHGTVPKMYVCTRASAVLKRLDVEIMSSGHDVLVTLLLLCWLLSSIALAMSANTVEVSAECACSDVLGEDVCLLRCQGLKHCRWTLCLSVPVVVRKEVLAQCASLSLLLPILDAMDLPAVLSVWFLVIAVVLLNASCKKFLTCRASVAPVPIAYTSVSAESVLLLPAFSSRSVLLFLRPVSQSLLLTFVWLGILPNLHQCLRRLVFGCCLGWMLASQWISGFWFLVDTSRGISTSADCALLVLSCHVQGSWFRSKCQVSCM